MGLSSAQTLRWPWHPRIICLLNTVQPTLIIYNCPGKKIRGGGNLGLLKLLQFFDPPPKQKTSLCFSCLDLRIIEF